MNSVKSVRRRWREAIENEPGRAEHIIGQVKGNRFHITFNRPNRYNAFTTAMYAIFQDLIDYANGNAEVKFIVVCGKGGNYSSGNDLSNFTNPHYQGIGQTQEIAVVVSEQLNAFCHTIIKSHKPIFAIVEGKVIGFAFTQLALFDRVFAVEGAEFMAPLVKLAQGPEMCASYTFPKIFGKALGEDLIVKGTKVSAKFLEEKGFLQSYPSRAAALKALQGHLSELDELEWHSYISSRRLFREIERPLLLEVSEKQCANLATRWSNPDLPIHLMEYMKKAKAQAKL